MMFIYFGVHEAIQDAYSPEGEPPPWPCKTLLHTFYTPWSHPIEGLYCFADSTFLRSKSAMVKPSKLQPPDSVPSHPDEQWFTIYSA
jgi:hypothetical protein